MIYAKNTPAKYGRFTVAYYGDSEGIMAVWDGPTRGFPDYLVDGYDYDNLNMLLGYVGHLNPVAASNAIGDEPSTDFFDSFARKCPKTFSEFVNEVFLACTSPSRENRDTGEIAIDTYINEGGF